MTRPGQGRDNGAFRGFATRFGLAALAVALGGSAAARAGDDLLKTLRPEHPRLYVTAAEVDAVRQGIDRDEHLKRWYDQLHDEAETLLSTPPAEHKLVGPRLLFESRKVLDRVSTLAGLHRLRPDPRFVDRARREMLAAAAFPDWNPSHFLDTAEMTNGLAVGYDWLYAELSPTDRATIRQAIIRLGLEPGLKVYRANRGWHRATHNWNQVCNGGLAAGALAIADEEPELARAVLEQALASIPRAMASFVPDGGWAEGPGYWNYATSYNVYFLAGLKTALGTDHGLLQSPGFPVTGGFRMASIGPLGRTFNFADAHPGAGAAPQMLWLAHAFDNPEYALHELRTLGTRRPSIYHLLWSRGTLPEGSLAGQPLAAAYRGTDVAFLRSAWDDPNAVFIGFKGGDNAANHSHLDLGSFVLDGWGQSWAVDLGSDDYNLPGYFGDRRWTYYRLRTQAHNTLMINGENQPPRARAPLRAFASGPDRSHAVVDLTTAYAPHVTHAARGIALIGGTQVLVQDELRSERSVKVAWTLQTPARVQIDGKTARLTQDDDALIATILEPADAVFTTVRESPPPPQGQQPRITTLRITLPGRSGGTRVVVQIAPGDAPAAPPIEPLSIWKNDPAPAADRTP